MKNKGRFLQIAIIAIFAVANLIGTSSSVAAGRKRPHVTRNNNIMVLEYDFDEPQVYKKGEFDFVMIDGFERYSKPGAPVIPVMPVEILVPAGMKIVDIISVAINTDQLPGTYRLSHGKKTRRKLLHGEKPKPITPTQPDPAIFGMTEYWPVEQHRLVTVQTNRGYNIAYVNLFPLQYSPKPGKIKMATKMRLRIRLASIGFRHRAKPTKYLKKTLKRKLDNPDTMESYDTDSTQAQSPPTKGESDPLSDPESPYYGENWKYVVITNNSLGSLSDPYSFQALCDSKIARGISAGIVTTEWIYANYDGTKPSGGSDNQTRIRNFLMDAYNTWGTEYALLGGDKDIIPARVFWEQGWDTLADMYYGCVDPPECTFDNNADGTYGESHDGVGGGEVDLAAEIFTGRAAVETAAEVINFVRKTLVYQTIDDPYLNQAGSMGGYLGFGGIQEFTKPFAELISLGSDNYQYPDHDYYGYPTYGFANPIIPNARNFDIVTLYDEDWYNDNHEPDFNYVGHVSWDDCDGWDATTDLIPYLNGTGGYTTPHLLYISDHGDTTWGMVRLCTTASGASGWCLCDHLGNVNNTRPFFFYDDSCYLGAFDEENCFAEVITTMEHGAFACIVNSRYGEGSEWDNLDSPSTQLTREFFHSVLGEGNFELGIAHQEAKESSIWRFGSVTWLRYVMLEVTLFGDPELRLRVTNDEAPPCEHTCGDLDGSGGDVDAVDFRLFAACWGENPSTNPSCACANLVENDDDIIDLLDFSVFAELFLSSSSNYPPNCSAP